jgi:pyridoxamine 5'-phosphate oxidase family protein
MSFTDSELEYLASQPIGRMATVQPDGTPQVNPVSFSYNATTGTIDIGGHGMGSSRKFRNVAANGLVALVVDDVVSADPFRARFLEIRGEAEAITEPTDSAALVDGPTIRLRPRRVIAFGLVDQDRDPHTLKVEGRNF